MKTWSLVGLGFPHLLEIYHIFPMKTCVLAREISTPASAVQGTASEPGCFSIASKSLY